MRITVLCRKKKKINAKEMMAPKSLKMLCFILLISYSIVMPTIVDGTRMNNNDANSALTEQFKSHYYTRGNFNGYRFWPRGSFVLVNHLINAAAQKEEQAKQAALSDRQAKEVARGELEKQIYRTYLANRTSSAILRDFLNIRF